jgi:hypothetical protein
MRLSLHYRCGWNENVFLVGSTKYVDPEDRQRSDIRALMQAIKADLLKGHTAT